MTVLRGCTKGGGWLAMLALAGCAASAPVPPPPPATVWQSEPPAEQPYLLQVGDQLLIKFYFNPELNEEVVVRPDGKISLQLIGDVEAAGQAPATLAAELTQKYTGELATPRISVIVRQLGTPPIYVGGEVGHQGIVNLTNGLTLFQAIQGAGGFLPSAHRKQIILIRRGSDGPPVGYSVDLRDVANGEHPEQDVPLRPYDVVFVPRSKIGDVNNFVQLYIRNVLPIQPTFGITPLL